MREVGTAQVGQVVYKIYEASPRERRALKNAVGVCDLQKGVILVHNGLAEGVWRETLSHEIGHAVMYGSGAQEYLRTVLADPDKLAEVEEMLLQIVVPAILALKLESAK